MRNKVNSFERHSHNSKTQKFYVVSIIESINYTFNFNNFGII